MIGVIGTLGLGSCVLIPFGAFQTQKNLSLNITKYGVFFDEVNFKDQINQINDKKVINNLFNESNIVSSVSNMGKIEAKIIDKVRISTGLDTEFNTYSINIYIKLKDNNFFSNNSLNELSLTNIATSIKNPNKDDSSLYFEISREGVLTGLTPLGLQQEVLSLPSEVTSIYSPTTLGEGVFKNAHRLKEIVFSPAMTNISKWALAGSNIEKAYIPSSIKSLGYGVFEKCNNLKHVTFDQNSSLTTLGSAVFRDTSLFSVSIPSTVQLINDACFQNITTLESVTFLGRNVKFSGQGTNGQTKIFDKVFQYCGIDKNSSTIVANNGDGTKFIVQDNETKTELQNLLIDSTNKISANNIFILTNNNLNEIAFGEDHKKRIKNEIKKINDPNELRKTLEYPNIINFFVEKGPIYSGTVKNISIVDIGMKAITTPSGGAQQKTGETTASNNVYTLDFEIELNDNFKFKTVYNNLIERTLKISDVETSISVEPTSDSFFNIDGNGKLIGLTEEGKKQEVLILPDKVKSLEKYETKNVSIFSEAKKLKKVFLNAFINDIPKYAFSGSSIVSFEIPSTVKTLGYGAFEGCINLYELIFNKEVTIKTLPGAMCRDTGLREIIVPNSVTVISESCFQNTKYLETVNIMGSDVSFKNNTNNASKVFQYAGYDKTSYIWTRSSRICNIYWTQGY